MVCGHRRDLILGTVRREAIERKSRGQEMLPSSRGTG